MSERIILGFDPGGTSGVAILRSNGAARPSCEWGSVASVDAPLAWFAAKLAGAAPVAIGIDTPLARETRECGWRKPDLWLRERYPMVKNSVVSTNSAYGAMVVQGPALAVCLRSAFPDGTIQLNETHPKVLYHALAKSAYPRTVPMSPDAVAWLTARVQLDGLAERISSDEWDAVVSAWATLEGLGGRWERDLFALC